MTDDYENNKKFEALWQELAGLINELPIERREGYREVLGEFLHDMKHTLGLITNANAILRRDVEGAPEKTRGLEMIKIVQTGATQLNEYLNILVEEFGNAIEVE